MFHVLAFCCSDFFYPSFFLSALVINKSCARGLFSERPLNTDTIVDVDLVKSKLQHAPPPRQPPGHWTVLKIIVQIPPYPGQNTVQMPHTKVHSGDQMPPPRGHFTGTKMTEGRRKRLQLSNKIFINITKTEQHC